MGYLAKQGMGVGENPHSIAGISDRYLLFKPIEKVSKTSVISNGPSRKCRQLPFPSKFIFFFQFWVWNPGLRSCSTSALLLYYIPSSDMAYTISVIETYLS